MKDLCSEKCKTLMKEIKDATKKWGHIVCSWIGRVILLITMQSNLQIQCNPYQNTHSIFFHRTRTNAPKICVKAEKTSNRQNNFETEQRNSYCAPWFQTVLQSFSNQNSIVLAQNRHIDQWNRIERSETKPNVVNYYKIKELSAGKTGQLYVKE